MTSLQTKNNRITSVVIIYLLLSSFYTGLKKSLGSFRVYDTIVLALSQ